MSDGKLIGLVIAIVVLIIMSAFFSVVETSFTSANKVRLRHLAEKKKSARRALKMSENYDKLLATLLIGNTIVNVVAASLAAMVFISFYGNKGATISAVVLTVTVLIFAEITPKSLAKERPEACAMFVSLPFSIFMIICTPLNYIFEQWKKFLKIVFRLNKEQPPMTEEEFKIIVDDIKEDGVLSDTEHSLINNALKYDDMLVSSIMTPLQEATMIDLKMPIEKIKDLFQETNYSRVPVYKGSKHNIIGILYRADFYEMMLNQKKVIKPIIKSVIWTAPNTKVSELFARLQRKKRHIAMVGINGKLSGLVTLDDIVGELVGEVEDEHDE